MKPIYLSGMLLAALTVAHAGTVLTLNPGGGIVVGQPGSVTGWGFTMTSDDALWTSVVGVVLLNESNPALGQFIDLIGAQGGPASGALAPGQPDWVQDFDDLQGTGFGSYALDPAAGIGDSNSGTFLVLYEVFSDNPNTCGGCFVESRSLTADFSVSPVPEPAMWGVTWLVLAVLVAHPGCSSARDGVEVSRCAATLAWRPRDLPQRSAGKGPSSEGPPLHGKSEGFGTRTGRGPPLPPKSERFGTRKGLRVNLNCFRVADSAEAISRGQAHPT